MVLGHYAVILFKIYYWPRDKSEKNAITDLQITLY